jgi:hypothetical protein
MVMKRTAVLRRILILTSVMLLLLVPAATRAGQVLDPRGLLHQPSGFSNSGNLPSDPVSVPARLPLAVIAVLMVLPSLVRLIPATDDLVRSSPSVGDVESLRAPPSRLAP